VSEGAAIGPPMNGIGLYAAAPSRAQARAIPRRPIDDHEWPQRGHEARAGDSLVWSSCAAVHIHTGDAGGRLGHLRQWAADSGAVQGCTGRSAVRTDAEDACVRRVNRGDQQPVERHL
jgi:hypothetical protein